MLPSDEYIIDRDSEISGRKLERMLSGEVLVEIAGDTDGGGDAFLSEATTLGEKAEVTDSDRHGLMASCQSAGVFALSKARGVTGSNKRQASRRKILRGQWKSSAAASSNTIRAAGE